MVIVDAPILSCECEPLYVCFLSNFFFNVYTNINNDKCMLLFVGIMSFRYTNELTGTLRHRLLIEAAHRNVCRRTFIGVFKGIRVECSGFGAVMSIRFTAEHSSQKTQENYNYYYQSNGQDVYPLSPGGEHSDVGDSTASCHETPRSGRVLLDRVATSIQAATWMAQQQRSSAIADAVHRALAGSSRVTHRLQHWYDQDPSAVSQLMPYQHLTKWCATPAMQATQYGLPTVTATGASSLKDVLGPEACDPVHIPIGSVHPLYTPALLPLEEGASLASAEGGSETENTEDSFLRRSRISPVALRVAQRSEMRLDEERFWRRVELVQRAQHGALNAKGSASDVSKRPYKQFSDQLDSASSTSDKVELRFTQ